MAAAAHLHWGGGRVDQLNKVGGQLEQAEVVVVMCDGEGHTARVLLRGHGVLGLSARL